jgi:hypothetical protein
MVGGCSPAAACPLALLASQTFSKIPTPVRLDHQDHGSHSILLTAQQFFAGYIDLGLKLSAITVLHSAKFFYTIFCLLYTPACISTHYEHHSICCLQPKPLFCALSRLGHKQQYTVRSTPKPHSLLGSPRTTAHRVLTTLGSAL